MKLLPKNALSQAFGYFTRLRVPLLSKLARNGFVRYYHIDMDEAEKPLEAYPNIASLFIRRLRPGARPVAGERVVSPVDGVLSQTGVFEDSSCEMIQAKGRTYSLESLLRSPELAAEFADGSWATIYLAPFNYHRIHSPVRGTLISAHYCPGNLWPVNPGSVERVEGPFAINERLISRIRMEEGEEILVVKVGATNVGRIAVNYSRKLLTNSQSLSRRRWRYDWRPVSQVDFEKGEEFARFEMGSTVILVANRALREHCPDLFRSRLNQSVRVGEAL